jgi:hypothetical protein
MLTRGVSSGLLLPVKRTFVSHPTALALEKKLLSLATAEFASRTGIPCHI